jgi:predicted double-glycine peptidase
MVTWDEPSSRVMVLSDPVTPLPALGAAPVRSPLEIRREHVIVQQWDASCGAAALATLLTYQHGDAVDERTVAQGMLRTTTPLRVRHRGGFSLLDLKRYADSRGFRAEAYQQAAVADLEDFKPAIVPVNLTGFPHFVIYRGRVGDTVLVADPGYGNRILPAATFEAAWLDGIAFVVRRRDGQPPPNLLGVQQNDFNVAAPAAVRRLIR